MDWSDIGTFLAVADGGSTLSAGRTLGVSQTTVARRIAALEAALGLALFERRQQGYALTPAGEALLPLARTVAGAADAFEAEAGSLQRDLTGTVRLTCSEIFASTILPPIIRDLHAAHPEIRIEMLATDTKLDLATGIADVGIRLATTLAGSGVVGRRIAADEWTLYCSRDYAAAHGRPTRRAELPGHQLIGGGGVGVWQVYQQWLRENGLEDAVGIHHSSAIGLLAAVRAGSGLAVLPCLVADSDPDLVSCLRRRQGEARQIWLITHERLRHTPRVRTVIDYLADRLRGLIRTPDGAARA